MFTASSSPVGNGRTGERANGRTGERANGRTGERANGRTGERANGRTGERANGRTGERAKTSFQNSEYTLQRKSKCSKDSVSSLQNVQFGDCERPNRNNLSFEKTMCC